MTRRIAPVVRNRAKEMGIDPESIPGTGKNGSVTIKDFEDFIGRKIEIPQDNFEQQQSEEISSFNHLKENSDEVAIGGMVFKKPGANYDFSMTKQLDIPQELKNNELEYRWFNDDNGRVDRARQMGYAEVKPSDLGDEKITVRRRVGTNKDGSDIHAVLMATPKDWVQERRQKSEEERFSKEKGMMTRPQDEHGELGSEFYNKNSGFRNT
jgi:hypothetical protein